ncbi:hypothetical protein FKP32DRAFT_1587698 [Trametes sanguinea]|nr:hypothetical protein FKP32DRAFT_1587698 [Trametes sanguinea]
MATDDQPTTTLAEALASPQSMRAERSRARQPYRSRSRHAPRGAASTRRRGHACEARRRCANRQRVPFRVRYTQDGGEHDCREIADDSLSDFSARGKVTGRFKEGASRA